MRAFRLALGMCIGAAAADAAAQTRASPSFETSAPASSPTLEAVATAPLACGGAPSWTEAKAIADTGRARRVGEKLAIGGMTFINLSGRNGRAQRTYSYVGVFGDSGLDLVHVEAREGVSYLLVDTQKRSRVELARFPVPSPSSRFFAVAAPSTAERPGGVEIVERTPAGVKTVATFSRADLVDDPCRLTNLTWLADDRFTVRARRAQPAGKSPATVTYRLVAGKWRQD